MCCGSDSCHVPLAQLGDAIAHGVLAKSKISSYCFSGEESFSPPHLLEALQRFNGAKGRAEEHVKHLGMP